MALVLARGSLLRLGTLGRFWLALLVWRRQAHWLTRSIMARIWIFGSLVCYDAIYCHGSLSDVGALILFWLAQFPC